MNDSQLATVFRSGSCRTWTTSISIDERSSLLEQLFLTEPALPGIIVCQGSDIRGLLSRRVFLAALSQAYGREIFLNRPLQELLTSVALQTLTLSEDTPLPTACRAALAREEVTRFEPLLVTVGGETHIVQLADLLLAQAGALERNVALKNELAEHSAKVAADLQVALAEQHQLARDLVGARNLALYDALHDPLTGLLNRKGLFTEIASRTEAAVSLGRDACLLFLDLDRFKLINDSLGHHVGNQLLVEVAQRLSAIADQYGEESCVAARHSGDEFVLLCTAQHGEDEVLALAQAVHRSLTTPYMLDGKPYTLGVSIGAVAAVSFYQDVELAMRDADIAMYTAKRSKDRKIMLFEPAMHKVVERRVALEAALRQAVSRGEFRLHYQPILDVETDRVFAYEALLRWQRPDGIMSARHFIDLAEETGLTNEIGLWVVRTACRWLKTVQAKGQGPQTKVSLNVSAAQIMTIHLPEQIARICREEGLAPEHCIIEVTEQSAMVDPERAALVLQELKRLGFSLALDDFGTGYSSLSWLHKYPFDVLKIDRSLTAEVGQPGGSSKMAAGILHLSQLLGLHVVAEGIERQEQMDALHQLGFRLMQGYHIGRPQPDWPMAVTFPRAEGQTSPA
ncbi:EAL domain-containing protein [Acidisoma cellulosilytica]|uniref:EAL domain-containing protein n=1 Tax=Acidisoma cellulosilyticum TaxID=2802395 RepID=A0A963YYR4_9PROT|nr:EAL domain-containing protein [Acidisoma cellulosilyticum]MCB8879636.1 EAL domain-containing protein [Acidisoma cellulosilyticum]